VIDRNLNRRHLDESQRAMVAAKLANMKRGDNQHTSIEATSKERAAELLNVGRASVERAKKVQTKGDPELQRAVDTGEISVSAAASIADLPKGEQKAAVRGGKKAAAKAAKKTKAERQTKPRSKSSKPKPERLAPPLNSLSWSEATPEQRTKFIDAVGVKQIWEALTREMKQQLCDIADAEIDAQEDSRAA
jgi:hypothetical protein